jgi:hypothetical protein
MHHRRHPPLRRDMPPEFFNTDHRMRIMVGTLVLNNHPTGISVDDLRYELRADEDDGSVDRAIGAMTNDGLLRRKGQMVLVSFIPADTRVRPQTPAPASPPLPTSKATRRRPLAI